MVQHMVHKQTHGLARIAQGNAQASTWLQSNISDALVGATRLAEFRAAEVIKIEQPGVGDPMRDRAPGKEDEPRWWKAIGRNQRLFTLSLSKPDGQALFRGNVPIKTNCH